jgi:flavin-dependent dehydrogenase
MLVSINDEDMNNFRKSNRKTDDYVDMCLYENAIPGFLWMIPLQNNNYRVGLFSNDSHRQQNTIITDFLNENFEYEIIEKYKGLIPIFNNKNRLVKNRAILIGDAASQIKPTTGGGLLIAFDNCKIANKYITDAVKKDNINLLEGYQKEFNKKYLKELNYQSKIQKTFKLLNDDDLDYLFEKAKQNDCENIISEYGDMDNQSEVVKKMKKRGLMFKIMPKFIYKKIVNIF